MELGDGNGVQERRKSQVNILSELGQYYTVMWLVLGLHEREPAISFKLSTKTNPELSRKGRGNTI